MVRAMFYQFPQDNRTYAISEQFMIGDAIMVCPVTVQHQTDGAAVNIYFPKGTWYDYYTGELILDSREGTSAVIMTPLSHLNMFVKSAAAFATQVRAHRGYSFFSFCLWHFSIFFKLERIKKRFNLDYVCHFDGTDLVLGA